MNKELIKQAFQLGYSTALEKQGYLVAPFLAGASLGAASTFGPGYLLSKTDAVNRDPEKYIRRGRRLTMGGGLALGGGLAGMHFAKNPKLRALALLAAAGGFGAADVGVINSLAGGFAKRRKANS